MKKLVVFITAFLFLCPLGLLYYKSQVLNLSLVPEMVDDVWNFHLTVKPKGDVRAFTFPIPKSGPGQKVSDDKLRSKDLKVFVDPNSDSKLCTWTSKGIIKRGVSFSAKVDLNGVSYKKIPKDYSETYPRGLHKYLKVPELLPEDIDAIETLETAILEGNEDKTSL